MASYLSEDEYKAMHKEIIEKVLTDIFDYENEFSPYNRMMDRLEYLEDRVNYLVSINKSEERMEMAIAICDKFEDYMKNIDKLNSMINEFKGLVAMTRATFNKKVNNDNPNSTPAN